MTGKTYSIVLRRTDGSERARTSSVLAARYVEPIERVSEAEDRASGLAYPFSLGRPGAASRRDRVYRRTDLIRGIDHEVIGALYIEEDGASKGEP